MASMSPLEPSQYPDTFHNHMAHINTEAETSSEVLGTGFMHDRDAVLDSARIRFRDIAATFSLGYFTPRLQGSAGILTDITAADLTILTDALDMDVAANPVIRDFTFLTTSAAATGVVKILDGDNATGDTVTIIDTAGKSLVYKCIATGGDANGVVQADGSIAFVQSATEGTVATNLAAAVNAATGHGTTITAAVQSTDEVLLTQDVSGRAGNTEMVASDNTHVQIKRNFAGGRNASEPGFVPKDSIVYVFDSELNLPANKHGEVAFRYRDRFA